MTTAHKNIAYNLLFTARSLFSYNLVKTARFGGVKGKHTVKIRGWRLLHARMGQCAINFSP